MPPQPDGYVLVPELAAIMALVPPLPAVDPASVAGIRARVSAASARQERPPIHAVSDRTVPGPAGPIPVRVYTPVASEEPLPLLVFAHGGGWVMCDLETHDALCREIANRVGCVVVAVDYRLAPEHPFPAALDDFHAAATWVAGHAGEIGGDPDRVAVGGDSAGGNLAAACALLARDTGGARFVFQFLAYPALDALSERASTTDFGDAPMLDRETSESMWRAYAGDRDRGHPHMSPLRAASLADLPPGLIVTAQYDMGRDDALAYGAAAVAAGSRVEVLVVEGTVHGFLSYHRQVPAANSALEYACTALRDAFSAGG